MATIYGAVWLTVTGIMAPEGFSTGSIHGEDARERKSKYDASSIREAEAKSKKKLNTSYLMFSHSKLLSGDVTPVVKEYK